MLFQITKTTGLSAIFFAGVLPFPLFGQAPPAPAPAPPATPPAAPAAPPGTINVVSPATLNRMFGEAETAFAAKQYDDAVNKMKALLATAGPGRPDFPYEKLYFHIGLGHLLAGQNPEAAEAFKDCVKRYPKGEFTSRANLGTGRALMLQEEKKEDAIGPLTQAARDPKFLSEAGLWLGQVYCDLGKTEDALKVFRKLVGSDVSTPQQTTAAVEVIGLLADTGNAKDLSSYLERIASQAGVRDSVAWFSNQMIARGDELMNNQTYPAALVLYRAVPPRNQILEVQAAALANMRKDRALLEQRVRTEQTRNLNQRTNAAELLNALVPAIELAEGAQKVIQEKEDLDAALLMRRGRCLFYQNRQEEAQLCFRTIREKYPTATDAQSAAFAEIVILSKKADIPEIKAKCDLYLKKYPQADNLEQVASLAGEVLVQSGKWPEVDIFYKDLEKKFPQSTNLDRFLFFQGLALFYQTKFPESAPLFKKFLEKFPQSALMEKALYYKAMSAFMTNNSKDTEAACKDYLAKFPDGAFAGDLQYRLSFIDYNRKDEDADPNEYLKKMMTKIINDLHNFLKKCPNDSAKGSMLCLVGDAYKRRAGVGDEDNAIEAYTEASTADCPDDVIQYALDNATTMLQGRKEWSEIAKLHGDFLKRKPDSPLALISATWVAKMKVREGETEAAAIMRGDTKEEEKAEGDDEDAEDKAEDAKPELTKEELEAQRKARSEEAAKVREKKVDEAAVLLANALKNRIGMPSSEQVEFLIDELVKTIVPRKKPSEIDVDAVDKKLVDVLNDVAKGQENATTNARITYARARLAQMLRRNDRADLLMKNIATLNAKNPTGLSAVLLSVCGDILLKDKNLDGAEAMFKRLDDRYKESMFADAGPVGLGYVELERGKAQEAFDKFSDALEKNPGSSKFKEATLGKLRALVDLNKLDAAKDLALNMVGDRAFRGEVAGTAYLLLAQVYRKQAKLPDGNVGLLKQAHGTYQRVYIAYQSQPDICAEAYWQAYEVAKELGEEEIAQNTLKELAKHPKLKNTARAKQAKEMVPQENENENEN